MARRDSDFPAAAFTGFSPAGLQFFRDLAANQTKGWYDAHKHVYEAEVRGPLVSLVAALSTLLTAKGLAFTGAPERALFRLHRDVRFSADKSPYKTGAGAAITRDGNKMSPGVVYFHFDPEGSFMAAGFYHPEPAVLRRLRGQMAGDAAGWRKVRKALAAKGLELDREDALVKPPKGFEAPADVTEDLKLKSWVVRRPLDERDVLDKGLVSRLANFAMEAAPLLKFGWAAVDDV